MPSLGTCDRHPSALAKYSIINGLLELTLCGHCRVTNAAALYEQGWTVIDADECNTLRAPTASELTAALDGYDDEGAL